ncbi:hypothetical protein I3760_09G212600 [Carya illinoinensis]|nr:hypothetical protein I3760_09G212600 [Carya illinoinensis]
MVVPLFSWLFFMMTLHSLFPSFCVYMAFGQCLGDQQSLLLQLKNNLVFDEELSTKLVNWNENTDCCLWEGVTCSEGRVIGLDLSSEAISDGLDDPSSLFSLQYLQNLSLAKNHFKDLQKEFPSELERLTNLIYLNLSDAGFEGQIPTAISRLTRLVVLDLSVPYSPCQRGSYYQRACFEIPSMIKLDHTNLKMLVQNLSELIEIHLDGVNISAPGNEWCEALSSSLPNLRVLSLSNCHLSGPLDPSLLKLQALVSINLKGNDLSTSVPEFLGDFKSLRYLFLSNSGLNGTFPKKIFQLPMLEILALSGNYLLGGSLPDFPSNGSLRTLLLSGTEFSGVLPDSFGKLTMLSTIDLWGCNFSGSIPESMSSLTQLVYLRLSYNHFSGPIPKSMASLTQLVNLDLSYNHFSGPIPKSMASLTQLVYLDLSDNYFSGPIPSLSMAKNLNVIYLFNNNLTGDITSTDWAKLQNLEVLHLENNFLTGNIPVSLFSLPLLQILILSNNSFSGQLNEFSNVSSDQLREVDLGSNNLEGPIPMSIFELRGLETLSLASNNFSGSLQLDDMIQQLRSLKNLDLPSKLKKFTDFLRNQSKLLNLDLSDNQIHGEIPSWIWIPTLTSLNLSHNYFVTLQGPLSNVSQLQSLYLQSNQLKGPLPVFTTHAFTLDFSRNNFSSIPTNIGNTIGNVEFLFLSGNKFNTSIPGSICNISELRVLDMSYNSVSGTIPDCLFKNNHMAVLNLESNNLSGKISDTFPVDCSLQTLTLNRNKFEEGLPKSLDNCQSLQVLDLGNNHIQDIFPCYLKNISSLRVLILRSNKFYGSIGCPSHNATWPTLQIIDLALNNFSGNLPRNDLAGWKTMTIDVGAQLKPDHLGFQKYYQDTVTITMKGRELKLERILTIFTSIDISCNNFDGHIPEELGGLKYLHILNLSHNAFTGQIPSTMGILSNLESLDLSGNKLTGEIPQQLADGLIFLSVLNLSFNQLVGRIPLIKQFATFSEICYEGNKGLCGFPFKEKCNDDGVPTSSLPIFEETHSHSGILVDRNFLSVELGFVFGFGIVIGPLMFWKRWRFWYSKQIDGILFKIFPKLYLGKEYRRKPMHINQAGRRHQG